MVQEVKTFNGGWKKNFPKSHLKFYCGKLLTGILWLPQKYPDPPPPPTPQEVVFWGAWNYQKISFFKEKGIFKQNILFQKILFVKFPTRMFAWLFRVKCLGSRLQCAKVGTLHVNVSCYSLLQTNKPWSIYLATTLRRSTFINRAITLYKKKFRLWPSDNVEMWSEAVRSWRNIFEILFNF